MRDEIETEDRVLVLRRIHVTYTVDAPDVVRDVVAGVHAVHHPYSPVHRSIAAAIAITTEFRLEQRTRAG